MVIRYLMKISGYSCQQLTQLLAQHRKTGRLQRYQRTVSGFKQKCTEKDIRLLAAVNERHTLAGMPPRNCVSSPVNSMARPMMPALSSHLYNLRKSSTYSPQRRHFENTRSKLSTIGDRHKPRPDGQPGYIRIGVCQHNCSLNLCSLV
jgi:hypothetical protein